MSTTLFSERFQIFLGSPSISNAFLLSSETIEVVYSQPKLYAEKDITTITNFFSSTDSSVFSPAGFPTPLSEDIQVREYSPSRKYLAIVKKQEDPKKGSIEVKIL